jgi:hypothetical protein
MWENLNSVTKKSYVNVESMEYRGCTWLIRVLATSLNSLNMRIFVQFPIGIIDRVCKFMLTKCAWRQATNGICAELIQRYFRIEILIVI